MFAQGDKGYCRHQKRQQGCYHASLRSRGQAQRVGFKQKKEAGFAQGHERQCSQIAVFLEFAPEARPQGQKNNTGHKHAPGHGLQGGQGGQGDAQHYKGGAPKGHGCQQGRVRQ